MPIAGSGAAGKSFFALSTAPVLSEPETAVPPVPLSAESRASLVLLSWILYVSPSFVLFTTCLSSGYLSVFVFEFVLNGCLATDTGTERDATRIVRADILVRLRVNIVESCIVKYQFGRAKVYGVFVVTQVTSVETVSIVCMSVFKVVCGM